MSDEQPEVLSFRERVLLPRRACADHYHSITVDYLGNWTKVACERDHPCELKLSDASYRAASRTEFLVAQLSSGRLRSIFSWCFFSSRFAISYLRSSGAEAGSSTRL